MTRVRHESDPRTQSKPLADSCLQLTEPPPKLSLSVSDFHRMSWGLQVCEATSAGRQPRSRCGSLTPIWVSALGRVAGLPNPASAARLCHIRLSVDSRPSSKILRHKAAKLFVAPLLKTDTIGARYTDRERADRGHPLTVCHLRVSRAWQTRIANGPYQLSQVWRLGFLVSLEMPVGVQTFLPVRYGVNRPLAVLT